MWEYLKGGIYFYIQVKETIMMETNFIIPFIAKLTAGLRTVFICLFLRSK